jgi:hypothetical protein
MNQPWRSLFGLACFLPACAIISLAVWGTSSASVDHLMSLELHHVARIPLTTIVEVVALFGGTIVVQIGLAAVVGLHCDKRTDMTTTAKIMWPVGCLFVGSVVLPIFFFKKLRGYRARTP